MANNQFHTWVLTKGQAGTEIQCTALAESLGHPFSVLRRAPIFPWSELPEPLWFSPLKAYGDNTILNPPWPNILITSGRSAAPVGPAFKKWLHQQHNHPLFLVHIQGPRLNTNQYDMVIAPRHAQVKGANVIHTHGSLHNLTPEKLQTHPLTTPALIQMQESPRLKVAFLIGGMSHYYNYGAGEQHKILWSLKQLLEAGHDVMVSASRRTPMPLKQALRSRTHPHLFYWDPEAESPNPYHDMLKVAQKFIVTCDSVSMTTELCALGKPVYSFGLTPKQRVRPCRLERFRSHLMREGFVLPYAGYFTPKDQTRSFFDLPAVRQAVQEKFQAWPAAG